MKSMKQAVAAAILLSTGLAFANDTPTNASIFCSRLLQQRPSLTKNEYSTYFDANLIAKAPFELLQSIFSGLSADVGSCLNYTSAPHGTAGRYILTLTTDKAFKVSFLVVVNQENRFRGILLTGVDNPAVAIHSWSDVGSALKNLDPNGSLGATLKSADNKTDLTQGAGSVFAMGSTFKLYILGALYTSISEGHHSWNEKLAIRDDWKSLPSGTMQNLPAGTMISIKDFATNMISISDNTAADHLLYTLGRETVQAMLRPMNNAHADLDIPLMSTLEMFKLKWAVAPKETQAYINSDAPAKLKTLNSLSLIPRSAVGTNGVSMVLPTDVGTLEWFGSTEDTCDAMLWLGSRNSPDLQQVLSKNVPIVDTSSSSHWSYVGYKGGSEPGVMSMTFLLESRKGHRACLSMSWNDSGKPVSEYLFMDVVKKTLTYAESLIP